MKFFLAERPVVPAPVTGRAGPAHGSAWPDPAKRSRAAGLACGEPFGGGPGGVGRAVQESSQELQRRVVVLVKPVARRTFLRHVCADMGRGEDEIRDSDLDWTIVRPPALTGKAATGTYRTAIDRNLPHGFTVSRADLAACLLAMLADPATVHRHVAIAS